MVRRVDDLNELTKKCFFVGSFGSFDSSVVFCRARKWRAERVERTDEKNIFSISIHFFEEKSVLSSIRSFRSLRQLLFLEIDEVYYTAFVVRYRFGSYRVRARIDIEHQRPTFNDKMGYNEQAS